MADFCVKIKYSFVSSNAKEALTVDINPFPHVSMVVNSFH